MSITPRNVSVTPRNETAAFRTLLADCQHVFDRVSSSPDYTDLSFRLHDGEDWVHAQPVPYSAELVASANSTGVDLLEVYTPGGRWIASFCLVWGNAPDGSELIADCYAITERTFVNTVFSRFTSRFD